MLRPLISPVTAHERRNSPNSEVDSPDPTATRTRVVGVRVSAPLRRGAAPYGDGSLRTNILLIFWVIFGWVSHGRQVHYHDT